MGLIPPLYQAWPVVQNLNDEWILINLFTVAVYDLRMCMKDNPCLNKIKGGNYF